MDRITKKENGRSYWKELVEEQEKSDLSQVEFCRQRQLVLSQFSYYRSMFKTRKIKSVDSTEVFTPVQFKANEELLSAKIEIFLPNGFQCILPAHFHTKQIKQLIEVLLSC